jgi:type IV secretory pathway TraG/TraD family ATPase VirD4
VNQQWNLDNALVRFSENDFWTVGDACEGLQIFGGTGSGKTSGSGKVVAKCLLSAGFGGLVLTAKKDEKFLWLNYAKDPQINRINDIIVFSPETKAQFNFLDYEMRRAGVGGQDTENVVDLFFHVLEASGKQSSQSKEDPFWTHSLKQLLRNAIDLVFSAKETLSLQYIKDVIKSAPSSREETQSQTWKENSFCYKCIEEADGKKREPDKQRDFEESVDYWMETFPTLADRTRSIIVVMFSSMADYFLRGKLFSMFCNETNVYPEYSEQGKIIIMDLPVKEYGDRGRFAQVLFKYMWQLAVERRDVSKNPRPVFLWADEAQNFCTSYDMQFQSTARSSRACTVYLTQNLPNYYAAFGGSDRAKHEANSLLGNLQTKIFHANTDIETNQFAAELVGKDWQERTSTNVSSNPSSGYTPPMIEGSSGTSSSFGTSEVLEYQLLPREFKRLKTGGYKNKGVVGAVIVQGGRVWSSGKDYIRRSFLQDGF